MSDSEIDILRRRIEREIKARKEVEQLLERKSLELWEANQKLRQTNEELELKKSNLEEALKSIELEYQYMVENLNDVLYKIGPLGTFTYVNAVGKSILGYDESTLLGMHFTQLLDVDERENVAREYYDQVKKQVEKSYMQIPVRDSQGKLMWFGQSVSFRYNAEGMLVEGIVVARDITEVVHARKALVDSEEKYRGLIEGMQLGIMEVDINGVILKPYRWFCDMVGYTAEELIGQVADDLLLFEEDQKKMDEQTDNRKDGLAGVYEIRVKRKDGSAMWAAISAAPYFNPQGEVIGTIGVHLDITEQKKLMMQLQETKAEVERAREAERTFFMNMSHEIRTPMNAVVGMSHLLSQTQLTGEQNGFLTDLISSSRILQGLISNVLDVNKIESGDFSPIVAPFLVSDCIDEVLKTLNYIAQSKGLHLSAELEPISKVRVESDKRMLTQILFNLIGNALKFTEQGTVTVKAQIESGNRNDSLLIEVTDSGIGISNEAQEKMFERHYRASEVSKTSGSGIGLAIVKEFVSKLNGTLSLESEVGKGTSVSLVMPVQVLKESEQQERDKNVFGPKITLSAYDILLVEDNKVNQRYVQHLFKHWKASLHVVDDLTNARGFLKDNSPDLILLDMQLPDGSGEELVTEIRSRGEDVPIVALTASAYSGQREKAMSMGLNAYLTKPFEPNDLKEVIHAQLRRSVHSQALQTTGADDDPLTSDAEFVQLMRTTFCEEMPTILEKLSLALKSDDTKSLAFELHKIPPMLDLVGESERANQVRELEDQLSAGIFIRGLHTEAYGSLQEVLTRLAKSET